MVSDFGDFMEMLALGYIVLCLSESYLLLAVCDHTASVGGSRLAVFLR